MGWRNPSTDSLWARFNQGLGSICGTQILYPLCRNAQSILFHSRLTGCSSRVDHFQRGINEITTTYSPNIWPNDYPGTPLLSPEQHRQPQSYAQLSEPAVMLDFDRFHHARTGTSKRFYWDNNCICVARRCQSLDSTSNELIRGDWAIFDNSRTRARATINQIVPRSQLPETEFGSWQLARCWQFCLVNVLDIPNEYRVGLLDRVKQTFTNICRQGLKRSGLTKRSLCRTQLANTKWVRYQPYGHTLFGYPIPQRCFALKACDASAEPACHSGREVEGKRAWCHTTISGVWQAMVLSQQSVNWHGTGID